MRGRALADRHDGDHDRGADQGRDAVDDDFRDQVGRRGQADGPLALEDHSLADEIADGQRGTQEHRADVEQDQDVDRLLRPGRVGRSQAGAAGHRQRQHAEHEREHRQEREVAAVGGDQPGLAAHQRHDLAPRAGSRRLSQRRRAGGRRRPARGRGMAGQIRAMRAVGIGADAGEDVGPVGAAHHRPDLRGRVGEGGLAAGGQQQDLVAHPDVGQRVRDDDDHPAGVGEPAQHRHHLTVQRRVEARRRFIEDQQRRAGQQFHRHRCALALPTGQLVDASVLVRGQLQLVEHPLDHLPAIIGGGVRWQPQFGGEVQRLLDGELAVHHVVLGHHPDPRAHRRVLGVDVVAVERDQARTAWHRAADQLDQRGFPGAGGSDHGGQRPRFRGEGHVLQQLATVDRQRQPVRGQSAGASRRGLGDQGVAGGEQVGVADRDDVAVAQLRAGDQRPVDESAVAAVVVANLQAGRSGREHRVHAGSECVLDDDVVALGAADRRRALGTHRGRPARQAVPTPGAAAETAAATGAAGRWAVVGAAGRNICVAGLPPPVGEPDAGAATRKVNSGPRGPPNATVRRSRMGITVGARAGDEDAVLALVDDHPVPAVEPQNRVYPRYQGQIVGIDVLKADVAFAVAAHDHIAVDREGVHRRSEPDRQWRHADAARRGELGRTAAHRGLVAAICR